MGILTLMAVGVTSLAAYATTSQIQAELDAKARARQRAAIDNAAVNVEQANVFYEQCRDNQLSLQQLNPVQRELLCSCVSAGMQAEMKVGDLRAMLTPNTPSGQKAALKMMDKVYFPCALPPLHDNIHADCMTRAKGNAEFASTADAKCECVSAKMVSYIRTVGIPETLYRLSVNPDVPEPLDALTNGGGYSQELVRNYYSCFDNKLP